MSNNINWKISLSDIDLDNDEIEAITKVLRSKWLSMGPVTQQFEEDFSKYLGVKYAFAVSNGTAALHIANSILGIGEGDEVIVPSLTFVATANSVLYCRAKPVFADITDFQNLNISPDDIIEKITDKTKAIIVVHYGGYPCEMEKINKIAKENNLYIIEDCAHAPGAEYNGKKTGTMGDIGCFSFFSNKNMTTGEGGMITTNDDVLAEKIKLMRSHGMTSLSWDRHKGHAKSYDVVDLGYNYRSNEISSALGVVQLKKLNEFNEKRGEIVNRYNEIFQNFEKITIPFKEYKHQSSYHLYPIVLFDKLNRHNLIDHLKSCGIQTSIHYPPIHLFEYYKSQFHTKSGLLPKTEYIGNHLITLPLHPLMKDEDVNYICNELKIGISR